MSEARDPFENIPPDELDNLDPTIRAQGAGEMSLLDEGVTMVGDTVATEELEASLDFDPSRYAGTSQYEVIDHDKPIGKGGFGTVWKVRNRKLGNILVMKRLHSQEEAGRQGITRFIQEARTIASLNHQNIITVYDIGKDDKGYFIIAEYVDGGSLQSHIDKKGPLSQKDAIDIAEQVGRALSYAHRRGVIHRDIKPANILLTRDGIPKVADFGLAKIGRASDLSVSGMAMGSLAFMPPEQRKDAKSADHRADIYALGKTLYHMLTGKIPETIRESEIPSTLRPALLKAIEPLPEDRYFTVEEFIRDLREGRGTEVTQETIKAGICPACGWKNAPDADYCEGCGAGLVENCPVCARKKRVGLAFCAGCGTHTPKYKEDADRIEKVKRYLTEKSYQKAEKECRKILSDNPHKDHKKEVEGYLASAEGSLKKIQDLTSRIDKCFQSEKFEDARPQLEELLDLLGEEERNETQEKLKDLPTLIKDRDIRNALKEADKLFTAKKYVEAMVVYREAGELGAEGMEARIEEAKELEIKDKFNEAESCLERYDFGAAIDLLKKILSLKPDHEAAQTKIREIEKHQGLIKRRLSEMEDSFHNKDYSQAEVLRQEVLSLNPSQPEAKLMEDRIKEVLNKISGILEKVRSAFEKKDYKDVKKHIASAYSLDPKSDEVKRQESELEKKINVHASQILTQAKESLAGKKYHKAMVEASEVLELVPGHAEAKKIQTHAHDQLKTITNLVAEAEGYHQKGKYGRARKVIKAAIEIGPHNEAAIKLKDENIKTIRARRKSRILGAAGIFVIIGIVLISVIEFNSRCIRNAGAFISNKDYRGAIRELNRTVMDLGVFEQKEKLKSEMVTSLLARADEMIADQKYTEPEGDNAVAALKLVLDLEPGNTLAKQKIDEIRDWYVLSGDSAFAKRDYLAAKRSYAQVMLIQKETMLFSPGYALDKSKVDKCDKAIEDLKNKKTEENKKIASLLAKADRQLSAQQYTTPEGDNVFSTITEILKIDAVNKKAKAMIVQIRDSYIDLGDRAMGVKDYSKADEYYQKAIFVFPGYEPAQSKLKESRNLLGVIEAMRKAEEELRKMKGYDEIHQKVTENVTDGQARKKATTWLTLGQASERDRNYADALRQYKMVKEIYPNLSGIDDLIKGVEEKIHSVKRKDLEKTWPREAENAVQVDRQISIGEYNISGKACPFFTENTSASTRGDSYKNNSPVKIPLPEGIRRVFLKITGKVGNCGTCYWSDMITPATSYERYGVSLIKAPYNSLIGVFMRDGPLETMGNSSLTTNDGRKPDKNPQIQQAFFIYHFDRSESNSVSIEVPEGARKLFLGTLDTEGWHNNVGTYHVTVSGIVSNVGTEAVSFSSGQLWVGSYTCVQGRTDLELRIVGVSGSNSVEAIFDFNHQASGCKGSFYLKGIYNSETREMNFSPGKWIKNTCGYGTVGMKGEVLTNPLRYEGRITHSGCGDFRVELVR